jgi:hypothetical protein
MDILDICIIYDCDRYLIFVWYGVTWRGPILTWV